VIFRRNIHEAIDNQIREAMLKPLTAENLNYISDLYLRKGEKELAIECLYSAITKLHVSQRDKMIAIYKKIAKLAPGDEKAYKGLIDIFAKMGLVAEEVNHLILLAKVFQSKGDYEKANELYRRIYLIDPENEAAAKHFDKGKPTVSDGFEKDFGSDWGETAGISAGAAEMVNRAGTIPGNGDAEAGQEELELETRGDRDISFEESPFEEEIPFSPVSRNKKVYLVVGIAVLLILLAAAAGFQLYRKMRGSMNKEVQRQETPAVPGSSTGKQKETGGITITAVRMTGNVADESDLGKAIGQQDIAANQFYSVTLQASTGCLPEEFVRDPLPRISFIGGNAVESNTTVVTGLQKMNRTVYKATVPGCGENKAVFMKLFVAHPKGPQYKGIAVRIMEKGAAETITWN
jgi:tetratricopeptide (TPR) repeat protein